MEVSRYTKIISFIVIFHVLVGSLAFVDWVHNFAHVFLWLAVDRPLALASPIICGSHLTSHDSPKRRACSQAMALQALNAICAKRYSGMCRGWTSKLQKTLNRGFRIAITGYTYGAALLCCVFLCH